MQELILYIKPQQRDKTEQNFVKVDLFSDENVSLTQVIQDVRDIDKVFTDFSRTFNIPASEKNNKLFKHWYNPDVKGFDANIQSDAKIELNYQPFREGKIRLQEVKMKDNRPHTYKVTFFGKTVSLNNKFGEDKLNNLEWINNLKFENTAANVLLGLQTGLDFTVDSVNYTDAIIYPLITHSQRYSYSTDGLETEIASGTVTDTKTAKLEDTNNNFTDVVIVNDIVHNITTNAYFLVEAINSNDVLKLSGSATISTGDTYKIYRTDAGNLSLNSTSPDLNYNRHGIYPEDLKPAIKASLIIKAIEEQYGLTFKTGEFFDSTEFSNLYLWLHRTTGKLAVAGSVSLNSSFPFTCNPSSANCSYFLNTGNLVDFTEASGITNILRSTQTKQEVTYTATITPDSSYTSVVYKIEIVNTINNNVEASLDYAVGTTSLEIKYGEFNNTLAVGQSKNLFVRVSSESAFLFGCNISLNYDSTDDGLKTANFNSNSSAIGLVGDIFPSLQVPEIKVIDFLKGIFKMFNLTAFLDSADNIVVKTLDDFYSDSTTTHDISKFIVKDEHTVSEALPFSSIDFSYPEPETKLAKAFSEINNSQYGKLEFIGDVSHGSKYEVNAPFDHLLYERINKPDGTQTQIQYGFFVDENQSSIVGKPLLFYGIYQSASATSFSNNMSFVDSIRPTDGTLPANPVTNFTVNAYWMPHNANELGTTSTAPAFNLNFGSEINSYTLTDYGGSNNSLFQKFYQSYIQRVFNTKTRIFKYKAVLPLKFLLTYSLADKIFVTGRAFTINKITTDLQTGRSTLELLNEPS